MFTVLSTSTAEGETTKFVTCKKCGHAYGYWMTRRASSSSTSFMGIGHKSAGDRTTRDAKGVLAYQLRTQHDPVPCPQCGHYQKKMIGPARQAKFGWIFRCGIVLGFVFAGTCMVLGNALMMLGGGQPWVGKLAGMVLQLILPGLIGIPLAAYLLKEALAKNYHPNDDPEEERIERGRERAMSPQEYAKRAPKPGPQLPPMP